MRALKKRTGSLCTGFSLTELYDNSGRCAMPIIVFFDSSCNAHYNSLSDLTTTSTRDSDNLL